MPNVGLDDDSPSSKSEGTPEEEQGHTDTATTAQGDDESPGQTDATDVQKSPHHQTFANGKRRRRKLPEIPKTRKCKYTYACFNDVNSIRICLAIECLFLCKASELRD